MSLQKRILLAVFSMLMVAPAFASISVDEQQQMLFIIETHGAGGDSVIWKSTKNLSVQLQPAIWMGTNGVSETTFPSANDALNAFSGALSANFTNQVAAYLKSNRLVYARLDYYYNFIDAGDSNTPKQVCWPLFIYPDGSTRDMGARMISTNPRIMYYVYHSLATAGNLPANWTYPDGGILYTYLLDRGLNVINSTKVNTNGLYDPPPVPIGDSTTNPDQGLQLLISRVVKPDMAQYSALYAIIDYERNVSPAYNCDNTGKCTAMISVESLSRTLAVSDGGLTYTNQGVTGYTLQYKADRYMVQPNGSNTMTATSTAYGISPTQNFNKSVAVDASTTPASLADTIIDPFATNTLYDFTNDTLNELPCNQYIYNGAQCAQAPISQQ